MATTILAAKLFITPATAQSCSPPRPVERLHEGLPHKLTLISAPAGFGKTTLISEWAAGCGRPVKAGELHKSQMTFTLMLWPL